MSKASTLEVTKKVLIAVVILALIVIDWLIFHDLLSGESYTVTEYLTGIVSIPIFVILFALLFGHRRKV